jgi:DNA-binding transcriptional LysR family regulator
VADLRSFSKAAAVHELTQSGVSQAMQQLEESLGVQLIDRSKRPLVLTSAGATFLAGVRKLVHGYHQLEQEIRCSSESPSGSLTIGTIVSVGLSYMPEATDEFNRLHPGVQVHSEFGSNEDVVEMTTDGTVDFGLVSFPKNTKQLRYVLWQQEPMRLVCSPSHPFSQRTDVTLSELHQMPMVGVDRKLAIRREIDQLLAKSKVSVDITMEFDNCDSMVRAIQANRGIGIVPEAAVRRETATGSLGVVACRDLRMTRPLGIIFRRSGKLSKEAGDFGSLLLGRTLDPQKEKGSPAGQASNRAANQTANSSPRSKVPLDQPAIGGGDGTSVLA